MAESPHSVGNSYTNVHTSGGRNHLGNVYNYGTSSDERTLQAILESLSYPGMKDRRDALAGPSYDTFKWTLQEGPTDFATYRWFDSGANTYTDSTTFDMGFRTWLSDDSQLPFCFIGKPGSGKSTLMKSLATDAETSKVLATWSKEFELVRAEHFIWILGTDMQKRYEGILRSLLHSAISGLSRMPDNEGLSLAKFVCGARWTSINTGSAWGVEELKQMLSRLASCPTIKYFFLVDALDECEPQDDLGTIAEEMLWISKLPHVKICVSCRPWGPFTRNFRQAPNLHLDLFTYKDMETYISTRLKEAEVELDLSSDFREHTLEARRLICDIANKAEGVFLWTILAVKALKSELRKGRSIAQLASVTADLPTDLDAYFQQLIYGRIPRTRKTQSDTAAALKLAVTIEERHRNPIKDWDLLGAKSFVNFWLLINGDLGRGFSWEVFDRRTCSKAEAERMIQRTRIFLEETCKDLLVMVDRRPHKGLSGKGFLGESDSVMSWDVEFLHRAVFDFLCDNNVKYLIEQHAPDHFSGPTFLTDLAKMRNIQLLQDESTECPDLDFQFATMMDASNFYGRPHLLACEIIMVTRLQTVCKCFALGHHRWVYDLEQYADLGFNRYLLQVLARSPQTAFCSLDGKTILMNILLPSRERNFQGSYLELLRCLMDLGCDPDKPRSNWVPADRTGSEGFGNWCFASPWEKWLTRTKLQSEQLSHANQQGLTHEEIEQFRKRNFEVARLLLKHGADPKCAPCIERHGRAGKTSCQTMPVREILASVILAEDLVHLQAVLDACSDNAHRIYVRKRQRLRALKHLLEFGEKLKAHLDHSRLPLPERSQVEAEWRRNQGDCLELMMKDLKAYAWGEEQWEHVCESCDVNHDVSFVFWCIDCEGLETLCAACETRQKLESLDHGPYGRLADPCVTTTSEHVVLVLGVIQAHYGDCFEAEGRYSIANAMSVLRDWYLRNTAGQDSVVEEVE